jgi:hypothetical protein
MVSAPIRSIGWTRVCARDDESVKRRFVIGTARFNDLDIQQRSMS